MEALSKYCMNELSPMLAYSNGQYAPEKPASREQALAKINRAMFVLYWHKFFDENFLQGGSAGVRSPDKDAE
jgi:hypothetical protein